MSRRAWRVAGGALVLAAVVVYLLTRTSEPDVPDRAVTSPVQDPVTHGVTGRTAAPVVTSAPVEVHGALRLEGQVVDEQKQPIGGARVMLESKEATVTTEADGTFAFDGLLPERYVIDARKGELYAERTRVQLGENTEPVILTMRRGASLSIIVDDGNAPIAGAKLVLDRMITATTDENGRALLLGLGPRFHDVEVTAAGFAPGSLLVSLADLPGEVIERQITLRRGSPMSGTVLGPDGTLVAGARVTITGPDKLAQRVTTDASGAFTFPAIPKGSFSLRATSDTFGPAPALVVEHDGAAPTTGIVLRVIVGAQLVGVVIDEKGAAVPRASILLSVGSTSSYSEHADAQGRFALLGIEAGSYSVLARSGRTSSTPSDVTIANDERVALTLVVKESSIAGIVVDPRGEPVAQARVRAMPVQLKTRAGFGDDVTDSHGRFDLGALPPGTYKVSASWGEHDDRRLGAGDEIVTGTRDARIVLPRAATLTGRVVFANAPMPYYGVHVRERPEFSWIGKPTSVRSPDGRFTIRGIHPGTWGIAVIGPGTARKIVKDIELEEGKTTDIGDVVMERGIHVRGHVRDAAGAPVAGATVTTKDAFSLAERESVLESWFRGDYSTRTNASGAYSFDGIAPLFNARRPAALTAVHPTRGRSLATNIPAGDPATLDLVLLATGGIDGVLEGSSAGIVSASRIGSKETATAAIADDGTFAFHDLAPGDWKLAHRNPGAASAPPVTVSVVVNQRAKARLVVPKVTVTVRLQISGECTFATLRAPGPDDRDLAGMGECKRNPVVLEKIAPGAYRACADQACVPITVADTPATQTFELRAK